MGTWLDKQSCTRVDFSFTVARAQKFCVLRYALMCLSDPSDPRLTCKIFSITEPGLQLQWFILKYILVNISIDIRCYDVWYIMMMMIEFVYIYSLVIVSDCVLPHCALALWLLLGIGARDKRIYSFISHQTSEWTNVRKILLIMKGSWCLNYREPTNLRYCSSLVNFCRMLRKSQLWRVFMLRSYQS